MSRGVDVYQLGSTEPVGRVVFTEEPIISPDPLPTSQLPPSTFQRRHRDTYFANLFRRYSADKKFDYDTDLVDNLRAVFVEHIERTTAVKMTQNDIVASAKEVGVALEVDESLFDVTDKMLDLSFINGMLGIFGLSEYRDEIMLREIDMKFGMAKSIESEHRQAKRKAEERESLNRETMSGIHNMLRDLVGVTRAASGIPEPSNPFKRQRSAQYTSSSKYSDDRNGAATEARRQVADDLDLPDSVLPFDE